MRPAPAVVVRIERFRVWHVMMLGLGAVFLGVITVWCSMMALAQQQSAAAWGVAWLLLGASGGFLLRPLLNLGPFRLRWDTRCWQVGEDNPRTGGVTLAIDLGAWMLLRFVDSLPASSHRRSVWIPVQRAGLEPQWHALRCAVYSPRSEAGGFPLIPLDNVPNRSTAAE